MFLANRFRMARAEKHLKAKDVAVKLGISPGYYSELESGKKPISEDLAKKFAQAVGVPLSSLASDVSALTDLAPDAKLHFADPRLAIKAAMGAKGLTWKKLAKLTRYNAGVLQAVVEGQGNASERMIEALATALDLDPDEMMAGSESAIVREPLKGTYGATPPVQSGPGVGRPRYVPLISMAQAGTMTGTEFTDGGYTHEGTLAFDVKDNTAFGIAIRGDSMAPKFDEGDVVIVYPSLVPRNGDLVICRLDNSVGGDVLFKLYSTRDNGRTIVLSSYNAAYPPVDFDRANLLWIYPVVSVMKTLRRH